MIVNIFRKKEKHYMKKNIIEKEYYVEFIYKSIRNTITKNKKIKIYKNKLYVITSSCIRDTELYMYTYFIPLKKTDKKNRCK